jgi:hypothetical protein
MKKVFLTIIIFCMFAGMASAELCIQCPASAPCSYTRPAGDGCNTCSGSTWCENDRWFTTGMVGCTVANCVRAYEIVNPYSNSTLEYRGYGTTESLGLFR